MSLDEEWREAFGLSLLAALTTAYSAWRQANIGTCAKDDVVHGLIYFAGATLAELAHAEAVDWQVYVEACQRLVGEAMRFARQRVQGQEPAS